VWVTFEDIDSIETLLREGGKRGVLVVPGNWFDPNGLSSLSVSARLTYASTSEENMNVGLSRLADAVRAIQRRDGEKS